MLAIILCPNRLKNILKDLLARSLGTCPGLLGEPSATFRVIVIKLGNDIPTFQFHELFLKNL